MIVNGVRGSERKYNVIYVSVEARLVPATDFSSFIWRPDVYSPNASWLVILVLAWISSLIRGHNRGRSVAAPRSVVFFAIGERQLELWSRGYRSPTAKRDRQRHL